MSPGDVRLGVLVAEREQLRDELATLGLGHPSEIDRVYVAERRREIETRRSEIRDAVARLNAIDDESTALIRQQSWSWGQITYEVVRHSDGSVRHSAVSRAGAESWATRNGYEVSS